MATTDNFSGFVGHTIVSGTCSLRGEVCNVINVYTF